MARKKNNGSANRAAATPSETLAGRMQGGPLMYVGPTIPALGIQNRVYDGVPAGAGAVVDGEPEIGNLFIRLEEYPEANEMLRERRGYIFRAYAKALELKKRQKGGNIA